MKIHGATPLVALDAVAIDTETTGLDAAIARVVQFGAVAISQGRTLRDQALELLVNPGMPIPRGSSAIHGIFDADVGGAAPFPSVWADMKTFIGGRVMIGHSIGFDLTVIERECVRAGLAWERPRTLCVRLLAVVANPRLPDNSLDTLAEWLGIRIGDRHRALGDAVAAAEVFAALLPLLAERGIRTLAEAERACLDRTSLLEMEQTAGWVAPVTRPDASAPFESLDPFAYRSRVRDLMRRPPVVVARDMSVAGAIERMTELRISSVFVSEDGTGGGPVTDYGIVTERDMMRRIAARGGAALADCVGEFATRPLASIAGGAFLYRAIGRMDRLKIRHLAVRDEAERLAGIISARDLLQLRAGAAIHLDDAIAGARSAEEMAGAWATLPSVARALIAEEVDARTVAGIVSEELRVATRRATILAEQAMAAEGHGEPPCPYSIMVLGSGGRGESLLAADQDNAIVFARGEPDGPEDRWFAEMGSRMSDILAVTGVPYCKGGIMASNALWRGSLDLWKARVGEWLGRSGAKDLLNVDIFFDQRPAHGDLDLGAELFEHAYASAQGQVVFAKLLGESLYSLSSPFTMMGGIRTTDDRIDLKLFGLFPIVTAARALAIRHGIRRRSTKRRLEGLTEKNLGNRDEVAALSQAHGLFMSLMLAQQSADLEAGIPASNRVEVGTLARARQAELKAALKAVQHVPDFTRTLMFG
jgi:DNA polymerase-3 subunit epsilon/CBS domain-containing protein